MVDPVDDPIRKALALAGDQCGLISRAQLREVGVTRSQIRARVASGRWRPVHTKVVCTHTGELSEPGRRWAAVLEAGPAACLDGVTALIAEGLAHFTEDIIRVSVPLGGRNRVLPGVVIRQTRRLTPDDRVPNGVPRTRPDIAAIRAAMWAKSDKQAALILNMTVQQGLSTPERLGRELLKVGRDRRREFIRSVVLDLLDGVRSISEAEFARECRVRGLPVPSRQVRRRGPNGHYYLDVFWAEWGIVVEIDGIQHSWATNLVGDALRQNEITMTDCVVLRLPLLGLRVAPDDFFAQIERALRNAGWAGVVSKAG